MKNITISVEENIARWARVKAAKRGVSLSKMISELLEKQMEQEQGYQRSMAEFLTREPEPIKKSSSAYPKREELYE
jgi:hypothetical protein